MRYTIGIGWLASVMLKLGPNGASRPTTARKAGGVNTTAISGQPPYGSRVTKPAPVGGAENQANELSCRKI
jgi:hypothetical protein